MARRPITSTAVLNRLRLLRPRIEAQEARLAELYAQRVAAFTDGRSLDPAGRPVVVFPEMAAAAGVSEQAIHKALRNARNRDAAAAEEGIGT